jgi:hypothetical protein
MLVFRSAGCNALYHMALAGNEAAVRFWLELDAEVNAKIWYTAHALADHELTAPNLLRVMLFCHGLTLARACRDGSTALMAAVCNDHASVVRLLLRHNARVNEQNTCASLISCICRVHQTHTHTILIVLPV